MYIIGKVLKPKGLKGEVKVEIITSFPDHFETLHTVYRNENDQWIPLRIREARREGAFVFIRFDRVESIEQAEELRNEYLYIPEEELTPLAEDEYYIHDLIGMLVVDEQRNRIGELVQVDAYAGNDVYVIKAPDGKEFLIPAIKDVVKKVDVANKTMIIHRMEGLID